MIFCISAVVVLLPLCIIYIYGSTKKNYFPTSRPLGFVSLYLNICATFFLTYLFIVSVQLWANITFIVHPSLFANCCLVGHLREAFMCDSGHLLIRPLSDLPP